MISMEGANCADLPGFVIDKYFDCNVNHEPLRAMVARAICSNCVVLEACRDEALTMARLPDRGILAGLTVTEIASGRRWRRFEQGQTDVVPTTERPVWLAVPDAAHDTERLRLGEDPDESAYLPLDQGPIDV